MSATSTNWAIHTGNALDVLRTVPAKSVDCVVTSPPYWSLREYRGTVGLAATRMGRNFIGIELSPKHAKEAKDWIKSDAPLFNPAAEVATAETLNGELFLS